MKKRITITIDEKHIKMLKKDINDKTAKNISDAIDRRLNNNNIELSKLIKKTLKEELNERTSIIFDKFNND